MALAFASRSRAMADGAGMADHRVHRRAVGQGDRVTVVGVAMAQVDATGALVGCLQVGHDAFGVEDGVVGVQQRGAGALTLPVRADGEDGQVVVFDAGQVVGV